MIHSYCIIIKTLYQPYFSNNVNQLLAHCTEVHFASLFSGEIYYCHSSKSTGKKTGKTHLCVLVFFLEFVDASFGYGFWIISNGIELNITDCKTKNIGGD